MKENYIHIGILMDASSSMRSQQGFILEGFNTLIDKQKQLPGEVTVSLSQFSSRGDYKEIYTMKQLQDVPELTAEQYRINGMTALNDAIGQFTTDTGRQLAAMDESQRPSGVMIYIMSDGDENHSREYSESEVKSMVEHQSEKYNWQFIYIGANQDSAKQAKSRGITDSFNFSTSKDSILATFSNISGASADYRSSGGKLKSFKSKLFSVTDEDLEKFKNAQTKTDND